MPNHLMLTKECACGGCVGLAWVTPIRLSVDPFELLADVLPDPVALVGCAGLEGFAGVSEGFGEVCGDSLWHWLPRLGMTKAR